MASPTTAPGKFPSLSVYDASKPHTFQQPVKKINDGQDVQTFLTSQAYSDIGTFIMQLNRAMCPKKKMLENGKETILTWTLQSKLELPAQVKLLQELLQTVNSIIDEVPPAEGPRRFGNISFRKWFEVLETRSVELLNTFLVPDVRDFAKTGAAEGVTAVQELNAYFLGGFGSAQRLDYGTGHELSFLAFLAGIWKLGGFGQHPDASVERSIVLAVIEPYLRVIRRLILTYTLEPAGSHGVWGLDDHSFVSYIFGSAQYCPAISEDESMPMEGSLRGAPKPADVVKKNIVDELRQSNMYFSAIGFINDVKTGPFWEHSPILFDISGIRQGWGKINKGMIKMYHAEVLSKFPVVQHFPFGSLFRWERDPNAAASPMSIHTASQPSRSVDTGASTGLPTARPTDTTRAPWANSPGPKQAFVGTAAPWAKPAGAPAPGGSMPMTAAPWAKPGNANPPNGNVPMTAAPWAVARGGNVVDPAEFVPSRMSIGKGTPADPSSMRGSTGENQGR